MLSLRDICIRQQGLPVVHKVSLDVLGAEVVALTGSNGAGKTSVAQVIAGVRDKSEGTIRVRKRNMNFELTDMKPWEIVRLGIVYVPESGHIFENMSVDDNLAVAGAALGKHKSAVQAQLESVCEMFPFLTSRLKQRAGTLSGGEKRSLAIARSLIVLDVAANPVPSGEFKLLVLDEPSHGLDPTALARLKSLILQLKERGLALLIIDQFASFALSVSDRGYTMDEGRIIRTGPASELIGAVSGRKLQF